MYILYIIYIIYIYIYILCIYCVRLSGYLRCIRYKARFNIASPKFYTKPLARTTTSIIPLFLGQAYKDKCTFFTGGNIFFG